MKKWNYPGIVALDLNQTAGGRRDSDWEGVAVLFFGPIPVCGASYNDSLAQTEQPGQEMPGTDPGKESGQTNSAS